MAVKLVLALIVLTIIVALVIVAAFLYFKRQAELDHEKEMTEMEKMDDWLDE